MQCRDACMTETAKRQTRDTGAWLSLQSVTLSSAPSWNPDGTLPVLPAETRPKRRELASMIDDYPSCKRLMEAYRMVYRMPSKTPLSILFEYASRLNLQVPLHSLDFCQKACLATPLAWRAQDCKAQVSAACEYCLSEWAGLNSSPPLGHLSA